jgi:hypothetical protein
MSVVEFSDYARPEPDVWQCRCGSFTFWLYSSGSAYCSECREEAVSMLGAWEIPERHPESERMAEIISISGRRPESS